MPGQMSNYQLSLRYLVTVVVKILMNFCTYSVVLILSSDDGPAKYFIELPAVIQAST